MVFFNKIWCNTLVSNTRRVGVAVFGLVFGLLALGALLREIVARSAQGSFDALDFCSRFTHQSTLFAGIVLLACSYYAWHGKESTKLDWFHGAATLYMILTGVVYNLLLNDASPAFIWDDHIMHKVTPIVMFLSWFVVNRPSSRILYDGDWSASMWLVYPLGFAVYSQLYGRFIRPDDYLYSFLDSANGQGLHVAGMVALLTGACAIVALVMVKMPLRIVPSTRRALV